MSCLVYDHTLSISDWLYHNGIFNKFIHNSIDTITAFATSHNLTFSITISNTVNVAIGIPVLTVFEINANKIFYRSLGTLQNTVTAWDVYTKQTSLSSFLQEIDDKTDVFHTKQDDN